MNTQEEQIREQIKNWKVIYPAYINSNFTIEQGRKISKSNGIVDPTLKEIGEVMNFLKVPHVLEFDKKYSRDFFGEGRLKFELKNEQGIYFNSTISSRRDLMKKLGEMIPKLKSRINAPVKTEKVVASTSSSKKKKGK